MPTGEKMGPGIATVAICDEDIPRGALPPPHDWRAEPPAKDAQSTPPAQPAARTWLTPCITGTRKRVTKKPPFQSTRADAALTFSPQPSSGWFRPMMWEASASRWPSQRATAAHQPLRGLKRGRNHHPGGRRQRPLALPSLRLEAVLPTQAPHRRGCACGPQIRSSHMGTCPNRNLRPPSGSGTSSSSSPSEPDSGYFRGRASTKWKAKPYLSRLSCSRAWSALLFFLSAALLCCSAWRVVPSGPLLR
jgi:hypothetical protein